MTEENKQLRELLGISRVSDPKFEELNQYLRDRENEIEEVKENSPQIINEDLGEDDELRLGPDVLASFRRDRERMFSMQRTYSVISGRSANSNASRMINTYVSTENALDAASGTPTSTHSAHSNDRYLNTNGSVDSNL